MLNASWSRLVKSAYRREPITSFIATVGAVDAVIGGVGASWSLFGLGITTVGVAFGLRWWQTQRSENSHPAPVPEYYLPPSSARAPLPLLMNSKKNMPPY